MRRLLPIILVFLALVLGAWIVWKPLSPAKLGPALRADFIDVGQGDAILIHTPDGASALIDAGEAEQGRRVVGFLKNRGIKRLDLVIMTHPHSDHIGGMEAVFEAFPVGQVLDSGYAHGSQVEEHVLAAIQRHKLTYRLAKPGMTLKLGKKAILEVLGPPTELFKGTDSDANNNSVVVRVVYGRTRILLTGDVEQDGEAALIAGHRDIESEVLKLAHHGSSSSTSLELLRLVRPQYIVISVGAGNDYGHPHKKVLKRIAPERTGAKVFRTDKNGTVSILTDGRNVQVETER